MISLATTYLGLDLPHPIVPGASPLTDDIDTVLRLEDAGAGAVVMRSIFEEQIALEQLAAHRHLDPHQSAEASHLFPDTHVFALGLDTYLEQLRKIRERTRLKVIGSLNGTTPGGWLEYARSIEQAGAHALELNVYAVPTDVLRSANDVEAEQIQTVRAVVRTVKLPVAAKLSPYYSSLPHFVATLGQAGARAVVLFNRVYQADIEPVKLEAVRALHLSTPDELLMRLRWLAILSAQPRLAANGHRLDFAASGGVHAPIDAVKALMAGATTVQVVSTILKHGTERLRSLIDGLRRFLEENEYASLDAMRGNMNLARSPNASAYERADYIHLLQSWHGTV
ncbi:MAG: dihydroorotate dehydrogenase-like protein [Deltaproteobacteria bacterium]|nr:dihydroorotate dehydrogenase-like protein [Deltaproteobacteria bacterium]